MRQKIFTLFLLCASLSLPSTLLEGQVLQFGNDEDLSVYGNEITEFTWMRGQYTNHGGGMGGFGFRRRGGWWDTDYPDSDENFLRGVQRYTNVDTNPRNHAYIKLTDPALFEHIFLYMNWKRVPIGSSYSGPNFSPEEIEVLREFMFRGGFVMVDDFWGQLAWEQWASEIGKILPPGQYPIIDIHTSMTCIWK